MNKMQKYTEFARQKLRENVLRRNYYNKFKPDSHDALLLSWLVYTFPTSRLSKSHRIYGISIVPHTIDLYSRQKHRCVDYFSVK